MRIDLITLSKILIKPNKDFDNICLLCNNKFRSHDIKICYNCCKEHNLFICKSDAKKKYLLKDSDLDNVMYISRQHSVWSKINMMLYLVNDVIKVSKKKHNIKTKKDLLFFLNNKLKLKEEKKEKLNKNKLQIITERENKLKQKLDEYGLTLRTDSKLCSQYINHGIGNIEDVVKTMKGMEFLYNNTKYHELMGKELKSEFRECKMYGDKMNDDDIEWIRENVKKTCVNNYVKINGTKSIANLPDCLLQYVDKI
jgi:hypothetical protein